MRLIVLGTGAGGGCPQWNCGCENCNFARNNPEKARTTDSLAVSYELDGETAWAIVNPGVDLRHQLARRKELQPAKGGPLRLSPIKSVILTDGELDHTMGLISLREGAELKVFATESVLDLLESAFPVRKVLRNYASLQFCTVEAGVPFNLGESLKVTAINLSGRQPRYAEAADGKAPPPRHTAVSGLKFESLSETADSIAYAPQIGAWDEQVQDLLSGAEIILVDGTFYTEDELPLLDVKAPPAAKMGHLPLSGPGGILGHLQNLKARVKLLTHINNTNPILRDNSPERQAVENAGVKIAVDGMCLSTMKVGDESRD